MIDIHDCATRASIDPAYRIAVHAHRGELTVEMDPSRKYTLFAPARFGAVAFIAIGVALFSLLVTFAGHPVWGLLLAAFAAPLGLVGLIRAISPEVRGGLLSFLAIALSAAGVIYALIAMIAGPGAGRDR